ncbi:hypothetical protein [Agromyces mariniharenae]|uniref:Uncharacterized protein n=1 Tax=Agromyces mariniharenae TaxID=2604423 RepID=A0A5S4UTF0_9MICO|nr:hypothetical protein [Agromyces mariniharenae]TYL50264.1 hypothetical protein FYC51_13655 [Agromyces mariniharenae]
MRAGSVGSYIVGVVAAVAAVALCIGTAILAADEDVIQALSLPEWLSGVVMAVAISIVVMVTVVAAIALIPRRWQ